MKGSGLGQFGVTALKKHLMKSLIMTDFHHNVINALNLHVKINLLKSTEELEVLRRISNYLYLHYPFKSKYFQKCLNEGPPKLFDENNIANAEVRYDDQNVTVQQLDWRSYSKESLPSVDVIVGSDIVFAKELHDCLATLISDLLDASSSDDPEAFIACTVRSDGMVQGFLKVKFSGKTTWIVFKYKILYFPVSCTVC